MPSFDYIAILGRQPELGLAELESLFGAQAIEPVGGVAALLDRPLPVLALLGGVVKVGRVLHDGPGTKLSDIAHLDEMVAVLPVSDGKTPFALSGYGSGVTERIVTAAGLELKRVLRERGSMRLITPTDGAVVNAAQLHHNRVLEQGFELLAVKADRRLIVAQTVAVQDVDWYSKRDYGRPARSAVVGMLPPKLAQIMINSTHAAQVIDPFCGSGVILAEGLLAGRSVFGSDSAKDMVSAARQNIEWLAQQVPAKLASWTVEVADARRVKLPAGAAVVSEGYLGPNLSRRPAAAELTRIKHELLPLYRDSLAAWAKQLPSGGEVSICAPAWRTDKGWSYLGIIDELPKLGYTMKVFTHVSAPLLYARDDQVVGRQLIFLRKQ